MQRSLNPSCLRTKDSAAKRVSFWTSRCTYPDKTAREAKNDAVDPIIVALAAMNHLHCVSHLDSANKWALAWVELYYVPVRQAIDKSGQRHAGRIPNHRRKAHDESSQPKDQPAASYVPPSFRHGTQPREDALIVYEEE